MNETPRRLKKGLPNDWPSLALLEFTVALARAMEANEMNQKALAEALGVSPPYISSVMSGNENLTVEQMSRLAEAAGGSLHLTIAQQGLRIRWVEDIPAEAATEMPARTPLHGREVVPRLRYSYPLPTSLLGAVNRSRSFEQLRVSMVNKVSSAALPVPRSQSVYRSPLKDQHSPLGPNPHGRKDHHGQCD